MSIRPLSLRYTARLCTCTCTSPLRIIKKQGVCQRRRTQPRTERILISFTGGLLDTYAIKNLHTVGCLHLTIACAKIQHCFLHSAAVSPPFLPFPFVEAHFFAKNHTNIQLKLCSKTANLYGRVIYYQVCGLLSILATSYRRHAAPVSLQLSHRTLRGGVFYGTGTETYYKDLSRRDRTGRCVHLLQGG